MKIEAAVQWERASHEKFVNGHYQRTHRWSFDGGATFLVSSSPHIVAEPFSNPAHADPEETFVASISSCHMLFFLSLASRRKIVVDSYADSATAVLEKDHAGRMCIRRVILRPKITIVDSPSVDGNVIESIHHHAHEACFLANSVKAEITIQSDFQ